MPRKDYLIGHKAEAMGNTLSLSYPVQRGVVTDWDDMEEVWRYMFDQDLRIKSQDWSVLVADATLNPAANREKMTQVRVGYSELTTKCHYLMLDKSFPFFNGRVYKIWELIIDRHCLWHYSLDRQDSSTYHRIVLTNCLLKFGR